MGSSTEEAKVIKWKMKENEEEKSKIVGKFSDWKISPLMINNDLELIIKIVLVWLLALLVNKLNETLLQHNLLTLYPRKFLNIN